MGRVFLALIGFWLVGCGTGTLPTAESLTRAEQVLRDQAREEYAELDQRRGRGELSELDYRAEVAALDKRVQNEAREAAWRRHFLAESERKANGIPTPDRPVANAPPNAMMGGAQGGVGGVQGGQGSLYRPFTMQSQGAAGMNFNGGVIPNMGAINNASTMYVAPAQQ
jgi:hypothetical protein